MKAGVGTSTSSKNDIHKPQSVKHSSSIDVRDNFWSLLLHLVNICCLIAKEKVLSDNNSSKTRTKLKISLVQTYSQCISSFYHQIPSGST